MCQGQQDCKPLEVWCPIYAELQSIKHALYHCQFLVGGCEVIETLRGPHTLSVRNLAHNTLTLLKTLARLMGWAALFTN